MRKLNILSFDCGLNNLAYCYLNNDGEACAKDGIPRKIQQWGIVNLHVKATKDIPGALVSFLDSLPWLLGVDYVAIEQQVFGNTKMMVMAHCIKTYFLTKSIVNGYGPTVHFVSARAKFKVYPGEIICKLKNKYQRNKRIAVLITRNLLKDTEPLALEFFEGQKKKDDLADSYLQGAYFLNQQMIKDQSHLYEIPIQIPTVVFYKNNL